ncbi:MAG: hypothetical protein Q4E41_05165 [Bacteroidales bacterium]|nr:hypothetical protein [Bacteroidales bacterium]
MNILSDIQQLLDNPSHRVDEHWLEEAQQQYPYFSLPALLYLKQNGTEENKDLLGRLAISSADRKVLSMHLGEGADMFRNFYPEEKEEPAATTSHAIDMFLDAFGSGSQKEVEVLENMIFNPTPDYADILAAEDDSAPAADGTGESAQDALINSFIAQEREKEKEVANIPQQHVDEAEVAEIADTPIAQPVEHDDSMLSESLAKMYISRRNYSKALEIIENINLNFPEKSIYFADQIRFLRKLVLNEKTKK